MTGLNKVLLLGRVGQDPNIYTFENGNKKISFSVATNENYRDKNSNEWVEQTEWHNIVGYRYIAEKNIVKGDLVYVEGKIKTRKWTDKDGNDRYTTEIVAEKVNIIVKAGSMQTGGQTQGANQNSQETKMPEIEEDFSPEDNDLPF